MEVDSNAHANHSSNVLFDPLAEMDRMEAEEATNISSATPSTSTVTKHGGVVMSNNEVAEL